MKLRTGIDLALRPDPATHKADQLAAYGQSQAGPVVPPGQRGIHLAEGQEEPGHAILRYSYSRILDHKMIGLLFRIKINPDCDLPGLGEFDGIAEKVDQNLAQPFAVAPDPRWQIIGQDIGQLQALLCCPGGDLLHGRLQYLLRIYRSLHNIHLPGFYLGVVQYLIDYGQQGQPAVANGPDIIPLDWIEIALQQEIGHAYHCIERRSHLMADIGRELGLGPGRCFGGFFCLHQLSLHPLLIGDIYANAESGINLSRLIQERI